MKTGRRWRPPSTVDRLASTKLPVHWRFWGRLGTVRDGVLRYTPTTEANVAESHHLMIWLSPVTRLCTSCLQVWRRRSSPPLMPLISTAEKRPDPGHVVSKSVKGLYIFPGADFHHHHLPTMPVLTPITQRGNDGSRTCGAKPGDPPPGSPGRAAGRPVAAQRRPNRA